MSPQRILRLAAALSAAPAALVAQAGGSGALAVRGGTVHTLAGPPLANGTVVIRDGRIAAVGADVTVPEGARVIDASGLHVYPGLFDGLSRLGLTEIGQVDVTQDMTELGEFNPHLLAATAVHPASEHIPVTRVNGVTHAVTAPQPRPAGIGGQATLMNLDGWTIEDMQVVPSVGFTVLWPRLAATGGFGGGGGGGGGATAPRPRTTRWPRRRPTVLPRSRWLARAPEEGRPLRGSTAWPAHSPAPSPPLNPRTLAPG